MRWDSLFAPVAMVVVCCYAQVCKLSVRKQQRLDDAQVTAATFNSQTHALLEGLADAERQLRSQVRVCESMRA